MNITKKARRAVIEVATSLDSFYTADLNEFNDIDKDLLCRALLENDDNWCDDILPPMLDRENYKEWIELIYGYFAGGTLHTEYRNAIYLYLEDILDDIVSDAQWEMKDEVERRAKYDPERRLSNA